MSTLSALFDLITQVIIPTTNNDGQKETTPKPTPKPKEDK